MLTLYPTTSTQEREVDDLAVRLFAGTYNLTFSDSYAAAFYCRLRGSEKCNRALKLVSLSGCSFLTAAKAVEQADTSGCYTAPLRGDRP